MFLSWNRRTCVGIEKQSKTVCFASAADHHVSDSAGWIKWFRTKGPSGLIVNGRVDSYCVQQAVQCNTEMTTDPLDLDATTPLPYPVQPYPAHQMGAAYQISFLEHLWPAPPCLSQAP